MNRRIGVFLLSFLGIAALPLRAQQPCPGFVVAIGTDEDNLMLAVNGADNPQQQVDALDKFSQAHPDSKYMPCALEYFASAYLKLNNFDKSIEYAEKDLAANYQDLNLYLVLMRAYASSSKVSDTIFTVINKVPDQVKVETGQLMRPAKATDEEWAKMQSDNQELAKDSHDYAVWAFFQVLPRVTDPAKRMEALESFLKVYPEQEKASAAQIDHIYFDAYRAQNDLPKIVEYGDKVVADDPTAVDVMSALGYLEEFAIAPPSIDKAAAYAQKAVATAQTLKKPEGVDDAAFKAEMNKQLGIAHLTLGYGLLARVQRTGKLAPTVDELKTASDLLEGNPALQGQALFYLANAYEIGTPANHRGALDALNKAVALPGPFQGQAQSLLAKVKAAMR